MNIDKLLKKYKLNQKDLAEATGINENTISRYCNGTFIKIDKSHISLICKYFKCTPNDIFEIDNTVEVTPAKIIYYDDKTDVFSEGEIKKPSNAFKRRAIWSYNDSEKILIPTLKTDEEIPESVQKEFNEWMNAFIQAKENGYTPNNDEYIDKIARQQERQQKEDEENYQVYLDNKEELDAWSNNYQDRLNSELILDKLIDTFMNKIIESFINTMTMDDSFKKTFETYKEYDYFTTNLKVKRLYRILHPFLSIHSKDYDLLLLFDDINNVYDKNGLERLSSDRLAELQNSLSHYINNGIPVIPIKQED
jgi:putative transcriptional regulator